MRRAACIRRLSTCALLMLIVNGDRKERKLALAEILRRDPNS